MKVALKRNKNDHEMIEAWGGVQFKDLLTVMHIDCFSELVVDYDEITEEGIVVEMKIVED